jgi:hypothetical protein
MQKREIFLHPSLGRLPARKLLECVFVLSPTGNILHHHKEEVSETALREGEGEGVLYTPTGAPPAPGRERCRIIPPFVRAFDALEQPRSGGAAS